MQIRTHKYAEDAFPLVKAMQKDNFEAKYRTRSGTGYGKRRNEKPGSRCEPDRSS